jgi:hypothetical protein
MLIHITFLLIRTCVSLTCGLFFFLSFFSFSSIQFNFLLTSFSSFFLEVYSILFLLRNAQVVIVEYNMIYCLQWYAYIFRCLYGMYFLLIGISYRLYIT